MRKSRKRKSPRGDSLRERLRRAGIRSYKDLIHKQPKKWLVKNFKQGADEYLVNVARLMRNLVWQYKERVDRGEKPPLNEMIRTYWYMYVKPALARAESLSKKTDQCKQLTNELVRMVKFYRVLSYKDIGFRDENASHRTVGVFANVIAFAEKIGHHDYLLELHKEYNVSIIALGGQPSVMNVEYFVDEIKKKVNIRRSFYVYGIVDYDPSGWIIRDAFLENLRHYGIKNIKGHNLVNPDALKREEIMMSRYPVRAGKDMEAKNKKWLRQVREKHYKNQKYLLEQRGGKLKLYGLEAEAVSSARLSATLEKVMKPVLVGDEEKLKVVAMLDLEKAVKELTVFRSTHPEIP